MAHLCYGFSNRQFMNLAGELLHSLDRQTDNKPRSINWLYAFFNQWSTRINSLALRMLDTARAKVTIQEAVDGYFGN